MVCWAGPDEDEKDDQAGSIDMSGRGDGDDDDDGGDVVVLV